MMKIKLYPIRFQTEAFNTSRHRFLFDFSPLLESSYCSDKDDIELEQAFGRYSLTVISIFHLVVNLPLLGYESDEAPGLQSVSMLI